MRSLEEQSDHELLSTIGRAQAILSQRQRESGRTFKRHMAEIEATAWPSGCIKPNSCSRHRGCMYAGSVEQCRHFGKDLTADVEAALAAKSAPPLNRSETDGGRGAP